MARPLSAALLLGWAASGVAWADIVTESAEGFVVAHEMVLKASPARAFEALTTDIAAWWDATHSYSGEARNLSLPARAGDCFCERLPNGGSVEHMRVVLASPGERLRMVGGLGPLQQMGASGVMSFEFAPEEDGTLLKFRYTVGGYVQGGLLGMAEPVDQVLGGQLARLAAYLDQSSPDL